MNIIHIKRVGAIDAAIGFRLRQIRQSRNLSQREVAERLGLTFQQIQKYEQGQTRISVAALVVVAEVLQVDPAQIINGLHTLKSVAPTLDDRAQMMWAQLKTVRHKQLVLDLMRSLIEVNFPET